MFEPLMFEIVRLRPVPSTGIEAGEAGSGEPPRPLPLHDDSDACRETAILAEVDSGYRWDA